MTPAHKHFLVFVLADLVLFIWIAYFGYAILNRITQLLRVLLRLLTVLSPGPRGMDIRQFHWFGGFDFMGQILGIAPGATGQFNEVPIPAGSVFPAGTTFTWTSSDTINTSLTPSTDGTACAVTVAATVQNGATSFDLTCTSSFTPDGASAPLAKKVTVPINFPTPPPPPTPTDMDITQTA